jgi:tubulin-folding cofactor B
LSDGLDWIGLDWIHSPSSPHLLSLKPKCLQSQTTVEALKDKLWRKTGTAVASMRLQLRDDTGAKVADLDDDAAPLAAYGPCNGYRIHVLDLDPSSLTSGGWLEDTSLVDKYEMSDEAYDKLHSKHIPASHSSRLNTTAHVLQSLLPANFRKFKEKMAPKTSASEDKQVS